MCIWQPDGILSFLQGNTNTCLTESAAQLLACSAILVLLVPRLCWGLTSWHGTYMLLLSSWSPGEMRRKVDQRLKPCFWSLGSVLWEGRGVWCPDAEAVSEPQKSCLDRQKEPGAKGL